LNESIVVDEDKTQADKDAEIAQAMAEWDEARDAEDAAAEEDDPEKPDKVAMEQVYREKIQAQREADEAFIEEFSNALKEKGILVIDDVKADTSADFVFVKLNSKLHNNFQMRNDLIDRQQASVLTAKELPFYEQSY
jgi:ketosteroid isomerase-like protein